MTGELDTELLYWLRNLSVQQHEVGYHCAMDVWNCKRALLGKKLGFDGCACKGCAKALKQIRKNCKHSYERTQEELSKGPPYLSRHLTCVKCGEKIEVSPDCNYFQVIP